MTANIHVLLLVSSRVQQIIGFSLYSMRASRRMVNSRVRVEISQESTTLNIIKEGTRIWS